MECHGELACAEPGRSIEPWSKRLPLFHEIVENETGMSIPIQSDIDQIIAQILS